MNEEIINLAQESQNDFLNYDKIRLTFLRNDQKFYKSYCRKIFATFLRNEDIEPELIDLLQGRIPNSVFVRHYYRPDSSKFDEIRVKLIKLHGLHQGEGQMTQMTLIPNPDVFISLVFQGAGLSKHYLSISTKQ